MPCVNIHLLFPMGNVTPNSGDRANPKQCELGGDPRSRWSSQSFKRHWEVVPPEWDYTQAAVAAGVEPVPGTVDSRLIFEQMIARPLIEAGLPQETVVQAAATVVEQVFNLKPILGEAEDPGQAEGADPAATTKPKAYKARAKYKGELGIKTAQNLRLGLHEVEHLKRIVEGVARAAEGDPKRAKTLAEEAVKRERANLRALRHGGGIKGALFGRMATGDVLADREGAISVAHAFGVTPTVAEDDVISAADDLGRGGNDDRDRNALLAHAELVSALYYQCVVVDLGQLIENIEAVRRADWARADKRHAAELVRRIIGATAFVTPAAKRGSTAPYGRPALVMAEAHSRPTNYQSAFLASIRPSRQLLHDAFLALGRYIANEDLVWGGPTLRLFTGHGDFAPLETALGLPASARLSIQDLAGQMATTVLAL